MDEEAEAPSVPVQFALKSVSNNKYLWFVRGEKDELFGLLQFYADQAVSPYTKFEIESSKVGKGMVHIRCCYNNQYWVLSSESSHYIVAGAKNTDEDQTKYTCTLFKPIYDEKEGAFRFQNVHLNRNMHLHAQAYGSHRFCVFAKSSTPETDRSDLATVVDWNSLCILPKYVAFKCDNGDYLRPHEHGGGYVFVQSSGSNVSDLGLKHEILPTPDGHIRIKNVPYNKFWSYDPNWIMIKSDDKTLFWPVKVGHNAVALRCKGNNKFVRTLTADGKENCLNACLTNITDEAKLEVTELVLSRDIYNTNFRLSDSRIYNEKPIVVTSGVVENLKDVADKVSVKLSYEDTVTTTWSSSVSTKLGVKITLETGVPLIGESEIEITAEIGEEHEWGETKQNKSIIEVTHDIVVPPRSKVKAGIIATQATCDVPFSYTQRDRLMDGRAVIQRLDDGIFTGINSYNFQFVAEEVVA